MNPTSDFTFTDEDRTQRAYDTGADIAKKRMAAEAPLTAEALAAIEATDMLVVPGCYDHVDRVLAALEVPYQTIESGALGKVRLRPHQLLIVNCPGHLSTAEIDQVRRFVASGGALFSTDWALRHLIEPAFPGFIEFNDQATGDEVVRIDIVDSTSPYLQGVLDSDDDPQWWLEGSSYPIRILDTDSVRVLIRSKELGARYGNDPVAVVFEFGHGKVFHMISHYYLQRTELRNERHQQPAARYAASKGVSVSPKFAASAQDLTLGEVEGATTSARLLANIAAEKKLRAMEK